MFSEKLIISMIKNGIVSDEEKDIYLYGLNQGLIILGNLFTMLLIAHYFDHVLESMLFFIAYIPLRSYAGGYHAKSSFNCYIFSIIMIFVFIFLTKFVFWNGLALGGLTLTSALIITALAPVEDFNKQLDKHEKHIYRVLTYIILCILIGMDLFFWILKYQQISVTLTITISISAFMLLLGNLKKYTGIFNKLGMGRLI